MSFIYSKDIYNTSSPEEIVPLIMKFVNPKSVLDVGCGIGTWLKVFKEHNVADIFGVDQLLPKEGILFSEDLFRTVDLSNKFSLNKKYDLTLCLEVAEHIKESSADLLIESLVSHSNIVLFSAAIPFQGGQGHVNERWLNYWHEKFNNKGFQFYDVIRPLIWNNSKINWWYRQNIVLASCLDLTHLYDSRKFVHNYVHPELFLRCESEKQKILNGEVGIRTGIKIILKSFLNTLK